MLEKRDSFYLRKVITLSSTNTFKNFPRYLFIAFIIIINTSRRVVLVSNLGHPKRKYIETNLIKVTQLLKLTVKSELLWDL